MNVNYEDLEPIIGAALKSAKIANERIDALPLPMVFKGTLGTGGTISTLPTASSSNEGFVYIVITDGTYAGQSAKAGDTFVSDGSSWVLVPSADEPSPIDDSVTSTALTWSSDKISKEFNGVKVKSFEYTGDGNSPRTITFPKKPELFCIYQHQSGNNMNYSDWVAPSLMGYFALNQTSTGASFARLASTVSIDDKDVTFSSQYLNANNIVYTVYYI